VKTKELIMPRTAASNGVKPYLRALAVIQPGVPVTPQVINDHVGTGDYAAKYISFLRTRHGFEFTCQKDGRSIVSYTLIKEPADAAALRSLQPKVKAAAPKVAAPKVAAPKAAKVKAPTKSATVTGERKVAAIKAKNLETMKSVAAKRKNVKVREFDDVTETFGTSGEVGSSFSVDGDWDSIEGLDLKYL
jgi:hypothetical protein